MSINKKIRKPISHELKKVEKDITYFIENYYIIDTGRSRIFSKNDQETYEKLDNIQESLEFLVPHKIVYLVLETGLERYIDNKEVTKRVDTYNRLKLRLKRIRREIRYYIGLTASTTKKEKITSVLKDYALIWIELIFAGVGFFHNFEFFIVVCFLLILTIIIYRLT